MKKQSRIQELYYRLRYRRWAVIDIEDRTIIYTGRLKLCQLVQDTQYSGLFVLPYNHAVTWVIAATVAESNERHDKR